MIKHGKDGWELVQFNFIEDTGMNHFYYERYSNGIVVDKKFIERHSIHSNKKRRLTDNHGK